MTNNDSIKSNEFDSELTIGLVCSFGTETILVIDLLRERLGRAGISGGANRHSLHAVVRGAFSSVTLSMRGVSPPGVSNEL